MKLQVGSVCIDFADKIMLYRPEEEAEMWRAASVVPSGSAVWFGFIYDVNGLQEDGAWRGILLVRFWNGAGLTIKGVESLSYKLVEHVHGERMQMWCLDSELDKFRDLISSHVGFIKGFRSYTCGG